MPGSTIQRTSVLEARSRAAYSLLFVALGLFASWELPEAGFTIPLAPSSLFLLAALIGAIALALPRSKAGRGKGSERLAASCLCLALFASALAWGQFKLRDPSTPDLSSLTTQTQTRPALRLTILDNPRIKPDGTSWSCLARIRALVTDSGSTPINRDIWLSARSDSPPRPGDRRIALGTFRPIEAPRNPGDFDLRRWAIDRNIAGSIHISSEQFIRPDESPSGFLESAINFYRRTLGSLRSRAGHTVDALAACASPDAQQLLRGLLLGENPPAPSDGLASFFQLGLAHILSISGFHLVVFATAALFALRLLGDLGRLEPILIAAAIFLFLAIVPASSPLVRAATILLVLLAAECFGRRYDRLTLLCWTAVAVLLFRPSELWSLGFQLSFGLTAALLSLSQRLSLRLFPPPLGVRPRTHWLWSRARHAFVAFAVTGMLCWALSAPWIAANVGIVNPLSIITGIVITPIIVLALWLGYASLLLGLAFPSFASLAAAPIGVLADVAVGTARWWDALPGAVIRLPPLSQAWALASTTLLAIWFVRARLRIPRFGALAGILLVWAAIEMFYRNHLPAEVAARVYLLDESPANCTIIRTKTSAVMVNAGTLNPASNGRDLAQVARHIGAWKLDVLILDTSDPRSTNGAPEVVRALRPSTLIVVGASDPAPLQPLLSLAIGLGAKIEFAPSISSALQSLPRALPSPLPLRAQDSLPGMITLDFPPMSE